MASSSFYQDSWNFKWIEIRTQVKDSILIYEQYPITSGVGGEGVSTESEVRRRLWIMNYSTAEELLLFKTYPHGNIKAIAYEGLLRKSDAQNKKELIIEAIRDKEYKVYYQAGCLVWDISLGEYLMREILNLDETYPTLQPSSRYNFGLSEADKAEIIELYRKQ